MRLVASLSKKIGSQGCFLTAMLVFFCLLCAAAGMAYGIAWFYIIAFILFQVFCIFIPGSALLLIIKSRISNSVIWLVVSYALGYCLTIFLYFLTSALGSLDLLYLVYPFSGILSLVVHRKRKHQISYDDKASIYAFMILTFFLFIAFLIVFASSNYLPSSQTNSYYQDSGYWMGNTIELMMEFPPNNFRSIYYDSYSYHYFSSAQLAVIAYLLKIPVVELSFGLSYIQGSILLAGSSILLFNQFSKRPYITVISVCILLFATGFESYTTVNYLSHLYLSSFGFDTALSLMMLFVYFGNQYFIGKQAFAWQDAVLAAVFLIFCFGSKGPFGLLALLYLFVLSVYGLVFRRKYISSLLGILTLLVCVGLYMFMMKEAIDITLINAQSIRGITTVPELQDIYQRFTQDTAFRIPGELAYLAYFVFCCNPVLVFLGIGACILKIKSRKFDAVDCAALIAIIGGIFLLRVVKHSGFSQMYFLLGAYPFAILFISKSINEFLVACENSDYGGLLWGKTSKHALDMDQSTLTKGCREAENNKLPAAAIERVICVFLGIAFGFGVSLAWTENWNDYMQINAKKGIKHILGREIYAEDIITVSGFGSNLVTPDMYNAYLWIRENTEVDTICVSDEAIQADPAYPYYAGVFSERHYYVPRSDRKDGMFDKLSALYSGKIGGLNAYLNVGASYIVQVYSDTELEKAFGERLSMVYSSGNVKVYHIQ